MNTRKGFTLVEILIVVVILGILAAIVIPQFTNASTEAKESSLVSNLQGIRSQIELYKINHNDNLPADAAALVTALTTKTKADGTAWVTGDGVGYGPYMQKLPGNPFSQSALDTNGNATVSDTRTDSADGAHWYYTVSADGSSYTFGANDGLKNNVTNIDHGDM